MRSDNITRWLVIAALIAASVFFSAGKANAYTCSEWLARYNGLNISHVYCSGSNAPAPYFLNKTYCRWANGLYEYRQGNTRRVGAGVVSTAYCPSGTTITLDKVNVGWRTKI